MATGCTIVSVNSSESVVYHRPSLKLDVVNTPKRSTTPGNGAVYNWPATLVKPKQEARRGKRVEWLRDRIVEVD